MLRQILMNVLIKKRNKEQQEVTKLRWQAAELERKIAEKKREKQQDV